MNLYESIDSKLSEQPKVFEKGPQVYSGTVQEVIEKVPVEGIKKVLEALRPEVQVKVVYNEEQNTLKVETEYFTAWDGEIPEVKESDESIETQELDERIKLTLMNPIPDDNFRIYYKDDEGNLYCDLFGDLYDCTKQGEPIDKVDASKFILDGIEEDEEIDEPIDEPEALPEPEEIELEGEPKIDTKEEAIEFLKADETDAIEGYNMVFNRLEEYGLSEEELEKYRKVLEHIIEEEKEHLEELDKLINGEPVDITDIPESVFDGYEKALPTYNDEKYIYGHNLSDAVDAVELYYGLHDRREAFNKLKNNEVSKDELDKAIECLKDYGKNG